ncbi:inverse autotransporter beta domain-containing protein [Aeromonas enteropelogenes]|uniref:inverse autotransporter beta domain-containing protein n=1 Tax=Aeromonas enteropelogenes TaxID=29489 RepID=UPI0039884D09
MLDKLNTPDCKKRRNTWALLFTNLSTYVISPVTLADSVLNNGARQQVVPYRVVAGDTLYGIALRHGLTLEYLLRLNQNSPDQFKDNLIKVDQVIYIPVRSTQELPSLGNIEKVSNVGDKAERFIASQASRLGHSYGQSDEKNLKDTRYSSNKQLGDSKGSFSKQEANYIKSQMQSAFQTEANERVSELLGGFGTAEVELAFDNKFQLIKYSADVLMPLVDMPSRMLFLQSGGRYDDITERIIVNLGVGQRHFYKEWMLGYNAFFDYDISRHHSRLGLGTEAWADNLKLSANLYSPLSGWKNSPDFDEYFERAARGFDFNAKYYLPNYPQLGVLAKVEQYFGDEVDLVGNKKLERNPYAGTVGIEWQPVPLLKVGFDHRTTKGSQNDSSVNVGMEWKFGASLDEMLNPANVALSRQLQGIRHDLVERNNNIVLEYKEKARTVTIEHIDIAGISGDIIQLNPAVSISKGSIVSWHWEASESLLMGGVSDASAQRPSLTLPELPPDILINKEFGLFLTVTDERGQTYQSPLIPVVVGVNPELFDIRLVVISEGSQADSIDSRNGKVLVEEQGTLVEFLLARQLKSDATSSAVVEAREVIFEVPTGYQVERLEGEYRRVNNAEPVWVNKLKITPNAPEGGAVTTQVLSIHAKDPAGKASGNVNLTLVPTSESDPAPKPKVSNLRMAGTLEVGKTLSATYTFDANGSNANDQSTYAWGNQGQTAASAASGQVVVTSGVVPSYTLSAADVGEVKEVSVQAKNGLAVTGNTVTVDSKGGAINSDGATGGGGSDTDGGTDTDGDGKGDSVIDPYNISVRVKFTSSASEAVNGVGSIGRPVAGVDTMTAECQIAGEAGYAACDERFVLQWYLDGTPVSGATKVLYTPGGAEQGQAIAVEAVMKP